MSDRDQLTGVFVAIRERLSRVVARIVPPKDIEDIVQETYVRVCQVTGQKDIRSPQSFMVRTAKNLALDYVRRHEYRFSLSADENPDRFYGGAECASDTPYEQLATDEEFADFCEAVRRLPVQCRRAFVLKKVYGFSQREISDELGISESTVEKHVSLGIRRCTEYMLEKATDPNDIGHVPAIDGAPFGGRR